MKRSDALTRVVGEPGGQSHRRNAPLFLLIGGTNVLLSLAAFAVLTSFPWSPLQGSETIAYLSVTVIVSLLAALLWDRVVWRTRTQRRTIALSLLTLWGVAAIAGLIVEVLVAQTGWNSFILAVLLTGPATAVNYLVQARLRRHVGRRGGRAA